MMEECGPSKSEDRNRVSTGIKSSKGNFVHLSFTMLPLTFLRTHYVSDVLFTMMSMVSRFWVRMTFNVHFSLGNVVMGDGNGRDIIMR